MTSKVTEYVPPKRKEAIVRRLDEEWLILDTETNKAHCLNETAARVWWLCDGKISVAEIVASLRDDDESFPDETYVWFALKQLRKAGLLPREARFPDEAGLVSRRNAMRKIGVAAAFALPVVTSILVPTPAQAASCIHNGKPCILNPQCCTGKCRSGRCTT